MPTAAYLAAAGFVGIGLFQVALALGAPLGRAAWGGAHRVIPKPLRRASAVAAVVWLLAAVVILARAGVLELPLPEQRWAFREVSADSRSRATAAAPTAGPGGPR